MTDGLVFPSELVEAVAARPVTRWCFSPLMRKSDVTPRVLVTEGVVETVVGKVGKEGNILM